MLEVVRPGGGSLFHSGGRISSAWAAAAGMGLAFAMLGSGCAQATHAATARPSGATTTRSGVALTPSAGTPVSETPSDAASATPPAAFSWSVVPSPNPPGTATGVALSGVTCVNANDCWAVGTFNDVDVKARTLIEQETGGVWTIVSSPTQLNSGSLAAVTCVNADDCWAVGQSGEGTASLLSLIEHYTGSGWTIVPSPTPAGAAYAPLAGVACVSAADCWAVGGYAIGNGGIQALTDEYTGNGWSVVAGNAPSDTNAGPLSGVTCLASGDCWAVGVTGSSPLIEENAGSGWNPVPSPALPASSTGGIVTAVTCVSASACWAVGSYRLVANSDTQALIEEGTGDGWVIAPTSTPPPLRLTISRVSLAPARTIAGRWGARNLMSTWTGLKTR